LLGKLQVYVQLNLKATVQTGFKYLIPIPFYVEAIFTVAGILFRMVQSFFCRCRVPVLEGAKHIRFSQFSCKKLTCFAPSKAVPGFLDGATTSIINFS
jgi:hypothetical protein